MHLVIYIDYIEPIYMHFILFALDFCIVGIRLMILFNGFEERLHVVSVRQ